MDTIRQLKQKELAQKEEQFKRQLKKRGANLGQSLLSSAIAFSLFPLVKGAVKVMDVTIGNVLTTLKPEMMDRALNNARYPEKVGEDEVTWLKLDDIRTTFTPDEKRYIKEGLIGIYQEKDDSIKSLRASAVEKAQKLLFGTVSQVMGNNVLTAPMGDKANITTAAALTYPFVPVMAGFSKAHPPTDLSGHIGKYLLDYGANYMSVALSFLASDFLTGNQEDRNIPKNVGMMMGMKLLFRHGMPKLNSIIREGLAGTDFLKKTDGFEKTVSTILKNGPTYFQSFIDAVRKSFVPGEDKPSLERFFDFYKKSYGDLRKRDMEREAYGLSQIAKLEKDVIEFKQSRAFVAPAPEIKLAGKYIEELNTKLESSFFSSDKIRRKPVYDKSQLSVKEIDELEEALKNEEFVLTLGNLLSGEATFKGTKEEERYIEELVQKAKNIGNALGGVIANRPTDYSSEDIESLTNSLGTLLNMAIGPGAFMKDGVGYLKKTGSLSGLETMDFISRNIKIPVLNFNPLTFAKFDLFTAMTFKDTAYRFKDSDILSTREGVLTASKIKEKFLAEDDFNSYIYAVGERLYAKNRKNLIDLTDKVGKYTYVGRTDTTGGIAQTIAMQTGNIAVKQPTSRAGRFFSKHDLPFNNQYNFQENDMVTTWRGFTSFFGINKVNKITRKLKGGETLSAKDSVFLFRFMEILNYRFTDTSLFESVFKDANGKLDMKEVAENVRDFSKVLFKLNKEFSNELETLSDSLKAGGLTPDKIEASKEDIAVLKGIHERLKQEIVGKKGSVLGKLNTEGETLTEEYLMKRLGEEAEHITVREHLIRMAFLNKVMTAKSGTEFGYDTMIANLSKNEFFGKKLTTESSQILRSYATYGKILSEYAVKKVNAKEYAGIIQKHSKNLSEFLTSRSWFQRLRQSWEMNDPISHFQTKTKNVAYNITYTSDALENAKFGIKGFAGLRDVFPTKEKGVPSALGIALHWAVDRPIQLLENMGLGRPDPSKTRNALQSLTSVFLKRVLPIYGAIELTKRINAFTAIYDEEQESVGNKLFKEFNKGLVAIAQLSEGVGFTGLMESVRNTYPGLMPGIGLGLAAAMGLGSEQQMLFAGIGSLLEKTPYATTLKRELEGEKNVAVRSGRLWELGRTPYMGGKITHYRPSQLYLATTPYEFSEELYGSPEEYLAYKNMFPGLSNAFGLNAIMPGPQQYYYEMKNYQKRPYPLTGMSNITNVPMVGQLPGQILSYAIKPQFSMHVSEFDSAPVSKDYLPETTIQTGLSKVRSSGGGVISPSSGYEAALANIRYFYQNMAVDAEQNTYSGLLKKHTVYFESQGFKTSVKNASSFFQDYTGMVGFLAGNMFGRKESKADEMRIKIPSATMMDNASSSYYEKYLGSIFGYSEFYRRVNQNMYSIYDDWYNPIRNTMPEWMPGSDYFVDFKRGDPYSKIPYGEVRLPGEAYEMTHQMFDDYGVIDKGSILLNVAPWSTEAKAYESVFKRLLKKGYYSADEQYRMISAVAEAEEVRKKYDFSNYTYNMPYKNQRVKIDEYIGGGLFYIDGEKVPLKLAGLETDEDKLGKKIYERYDVSSTSAFEQAYSAIKGMDEYYESLEGEYIDITRAQDDDVAYQFAGSQVYLEAFSDQAIEKAGKMSPMLLDTSTDIGKRAVYGTSPGKQFWEWFTHRWGFYQEKFWPEKSALEEYERYVTFGSYSAQWQSFTKDYLQQETFNLANLNPLEASTHGGMVGWQFGSTPGASMIFSALGSVFGGLLSLSHNEPLIPEETRERWELEKKYDFAAAARQKLGLERTQSVAAMDKSETLRGMALRLPRIEREFLEQFVNAPEKDLERILQVTPDYMQEMVKYGRQVKQARIRGEKAPLFQNEYKQEFLTYYEGLNKMGNLEQNPMINPAFSLDKMKTYEAYHAFENYSKFNIYTDDIREAAISILQQNIPSIDEEILYYALEQQAMLEAMASRKTLKYSLNYR